MHYGYFISFLVMFNGQDSPIILKMCFIKKKGYGIIMNFADFF